MEERAYKKELEDYLSQYTLISTYSVEAIEEAAYESEPAEAYRETEERLEKELSDNPASAMSKPDITLINVNGTDYDSRNSTFWIISGLDADYGNLVQMENLRSVHVGENGEGRGYFDLDKLSCISGTLRQLVISCFTEFDIEKLPQFENLDTLLIEAEIDSVDVISSMGWLKELRITVASDSEVDITPLPELKNLRTLTVWGDLENFDFTSGMDKLQAVYYYGSFENTDFSALAELPSFKALVFSSSADCPDEKLSVFADRDDLVIAR